MNFNLSSTYSLNIPLGLSIGNLTASCKGFTIKPAFWAVVGIENFNFKNSTGIDPPSSKFNKISPVYS